MGHLIDDLLTYARLGRSSVRREPVSLASLVNEIVSNMQSSLDEVHGTINIASDLPTIIGDPTLLRQIFTNLLETLSNTTNQVIPNVTVACQSEDRYIIVRVSDTALALPLSIRKKYSTFFNACIPKMNTPAPALAWQPSGNQLNCWAAGCGRSRNRRRGQHFRWS
jgi:light-regulated signal transduction histidine kinase (bacteriophytochrome)